MINTPRRAHPAVAFVCVLVLASAATAGADMITPIESPLPPGGWYTTTAGQTIEFPGLGIILLNPAIGYFAQAGGPATYTFQAMFNAFCQVGGCAGQMVHAGAGPASIDATPTGSGTWDVEFSSSDLVGNGPGVLLREHSTLASEGEMTSQGAGPGLFEIDSFFDVWFELSLDGGDNWFSSSDSTNFYLDEAPPMGGPAIPEPGTLLLFGTGSLAVARTVRRKRE